MSQLIGDSLYISGSPSILELYGTYESKTAGVNAVKVGVYKNVPKGLRFGVVTVDGFEEYIYVGPVVAKANVQANDFVKIFPIDEATEQIAGLMSATDKTTLDELTLVLQAGGWNIDSNFQVGGTSAGSATIPEGLETRLNRIETILEGLYGEASDGSEDSKFIVEDDGNSNN